MYCTSVYLVLYLRTSVLSRMHTTIYNSVLFFSSSLLLSLSRYHTATLKMGRKGVIRRAEDANPEYMREYEKASSEAWNQYRKNIRPRPVLERLREDPLRPLLLVALHALQVNELTRSGSLTLDLLVQALLGIYLADFFSGCLHLFFDYYEVDLSLPNQRGVLAYGAWGFQYHHSQNKNWLCQSLKSAQLYAISLSPLTFPPAHRY